MPRGTIHKLPANAVKVLGVGFHPDGGSLYLNVRPGSRSWSFRYTQPGTGKRREMGLGSADSLPLAAARKRAAELREMVAMGMDPLGEPKPAVIHQAAGRTLGAVFDSHHEANAPHWKNAKHRQQWTNSLATYAGELMRKPVDQIETADIVAVLSPIWTEKAETARRVRGRLEMLLDFAAAHGGRPQGPNPAALAVVKHGLPKVRKSDRHFKAVPVEMAPQTFRMIWERRDEGMGAAALCFLILGGFRSNEVRGLRWSDLRADHVEIDADRMKAGRRYRVPLTDPMRALLERPKVAPIIFCGSAGHPLSDGTMTSVHKRWGIDATVHGWRTSFRQWAANAGYPRDLPEAAIAHSLARSDTEAAYLRDADLLEARRPMMAAWAAYLLGDLEQIA